MNFLLRLCTKSDDLCIIDSEILAVLFRSFSDANPYDCSTACYAHIPKSQNEECETEYYLKSPELQGNHIIFLQFCRETIPLGTKLLICHV